MSDNGSGMLAAETTEGLKRLSTIHERTLAESPYQNGKQESWWNQVEGRLLAMLEGEPRLTLDLLNEATQAWVEFEYHRQVHSDLGVTPMERFLAAPDVGRPSPTSAELRAAFRMTTARTPRKSDGTVSIAACRYEVPNRYRHLSKIAVRYARWDLSYVDMVDLPSDKVLSPLFPLDKHANADGRRRSLDPIASGAPDGPVPLSGMAPLLSEILEQHRATGLPPAYLPLGPKGDNHNNKETIDE